MDTSFYFLPLYHVATMRDGVQVWVPHRDPTLECVRLEAERIQIAGGVVDAKPWLRREFYERECRRWRWAVVAMFVVASTLMGWFLKAMPGIDPSISENFLACELMGMALVGAALAAFQMSDKSTSRPKGLPV
jgi:hypothetical protein